MFKSLQQGLIVLEDIDAFYFQSHPTSEEDRLFDQHLELLIKYHELFLLKYSGKIKIDEPSNETDLLEQMSTFLENVIHSYNQDQRHKIQLTVIGSSIYNYAYQVNRLNTVVEQYKKNQKRE